MKMYLNRIRTEKEMSIRELAEISGVSKSQIEEIEAGRANPSVGTLCKLARALEVNVHELFDCN